MNQRKLQAVINRLKDDIKNIKCSIPRITEENVCQVANDEGFINGIEFAIEKLEMLKESIDKE
tara:strand:+ start:26 stop:214 length:189 start_codon:yes stop_codon:yes gene_type:complete